MVFPLLICTFAIDHWHLGLSGGCWCDFRGLNISVGYYSKCSETCRIFVGGYALITNISANMAKSLIEELPRIVTTQNKIYLIETKGNDKLFDKNVRQKQTAAVEWTRKINELKPDERMDREWEYVLISEDNFYGLSHNGATITDICDRCKVSLSAAMGELFV